MGGEFVVGTPKSDAGVRDVAIPPHLVDLVAEHLRHHTEVGRDGLLFPATGGGHMAPSEPVPCLLSGPREIGAARSLFPRLAPHRRCPRRRYPRKAAFLASEAYKGDPDACVVQPDRP